MARAESARADASLVHVGPDARVELVDLRRAGGQELARRLEVLPNTLSTNLGILAQAGLVTSQREGRSIIYRAHYEAMGELLAYLVEDCCAGSPEICAPLARLASGCCAA